jgi:hypothetical protein
MPASAFSLDPNCAPQTGTPPIVHGWHFEGTEWAMTENGTGANFGDEARIGIREWESATLTNGQRPVDTPETGSYTLKWSNLGIGVYGRIDPSSNCAFFELNTNSWAMDQFENDPGLIRATVRH